MSDNNPEEDASVDVIDTLRRQTEALQQELDSLREQAKKNAILADIKVAAIRAGMIDLDGIKLLDLSGVRPDGDDQAPDVSHIMSDLKKNKPWLFGVWSTSSSKEVPSSQPPRQKQAMEMSDEEYHAARSLILKRRP